MDKENATKVVIVDDDTFLLDMYSIKFSKAGYDIKTYPHGEDLLRDLKDGMTPHIIILDVVMPKIDGIQLLTEIRTQKYAPNATVVILSNQGQPADIEKAQKLGIDGYIIKALTIPSEVVDQVTRIHKAKIAPK